MANILVRSEVGAAPDTVWASIRDRAVLADAGARAEATGGALTRGEAVAFAQIGWRVHLMDGPRVMVWMHRKGIGWARMKVRFDLTPKAYGTELVVIAVPSGVLGWTMRNRVAGLRGDLDRLAVAIKNHAEGAQT